MGMGRALMAMGVVVMTVTAAQSQVYGGRPRQLASSATDVQAAAKAAKGCGDRLAGQVFRCSVAAESGGTLQDCLRFTQPGAVSDKFDMTSDLAGITIGCTCKAKGSSKKPKFGALPVFECTGDDGDDDLSFEGTIAKSGKKISKGFLSNGVGGSFVFDCTADAGCTVAP